jgi:uncharacterized membrane protein
MSDWYYAADNEQKGPINESELKANLASNKLPADTLVWKDGMDNWTPANQVPAFTFRQPPTPAKVQPPVAGAPAATPTPSAKADPSVNNPDSTKPVDMKSLMGTPEALEVDADDATTNKIFGILAYLSFLCFVPIIIAKDSPYAKYHANQGLVLFLAEFATILITSAFVFIPFLGIIVYYLHLILLLVFTGVSVLGIINAAAGKCVPLPIIGGIKLLK